MSTLICAMLSCSATGERENAKDAQSSSGNASSGNSSSGNSSGSSSSGAGSSSSGSVIDPNAQCPVKVRFKPPANMSVSSAALAGEFNKWDANNAMSGPDAQGEYTADVVLTPGLWAYKIVVNGSQWMLDPGQGFRKYVGGEENSALAVEDCTRPLLQKLSSSLSAGSFKAELQYIDGIGKHGFDNASVKATLKYQGMEVAVKANISGDPPVLSLEANSLGNGKYTLVVQASDKMGHESNPLRLIYWIEDQSFEWKDALIYMIMTDRFKDGDPSNNSGPTPGIADARADFMGGDLEGVRQEIEKGTLSDLGVRAIWLTPFATNPDGAYLAADQKHLVTGYHGYWPVKAREVDPRLGGEAALKAMVDAAHKKGIRVLMDFVINHVHHAHEYYIDHPEWFRAGCVCGTQDCDWTAKRLECVFATYMPDVNYTVPEATAQFVDDAVWWLDTFDLDGLRVDAVKHVEDVAITNLATTVRQKFENAGTRYFLMGETAMGWVEPNIGCGGDIACNANEYGTISRYIGPFGLDGQFDFVLYHAVPYRVFAYGEKSLIHADVWAQNSIAAYPQDSVMTPYIGSHDTVRFVTMANYRDQDAAHPKGIANNQWDNVAQPVDDPNAFDRHSLALSWLLGLPGAPLLYYGDEYAQYGGADPGNRAMFRSNAAELLPAEAAQLSRTKAFGQARKELGALRRGNYVSLKAENEFLAYGRSTGQPGEVAIVALARAAALQKVVTLPGSFGLSAGTLLHDRLGGPDITVGAGGTITVSLGAYEAALYTP